MRRQATLLILALGCLVGLVVCGHAGGRLTISDAEILRDINTRRLSEGLTKLQMDAILSDVLQRKIDKAAAQESRMLLMDADWTRDLVGCVPDWDVRYFVGSGESESGVLRALMSQPDFPQASIGPQATHFAMACQRQPGGELGCVVCIIRRLVELGPFEVQVNEGGPTYLTVQGMSRFPCLRVSFYRGTQEPTTYDGEQYTIHAATDEAGRFKTTLPISMFGDGDYRIVVCVAERSDAEYVIAARTRFHVGQ